MTDSGKPSILMVTYSDPDIYSPIINSARLLARAGYQVHILGYYRGRENSVEYGKGIVLTRGNELPGNFPDKAFAKISELYNFKKQVTRLIKKRHYLLVIGHDPLGFWAAHELCQKENIPLVFHCHDFASSGKVNILNIKLPDIIELTCARLARHADAIIFPERSRAAWGKIKWRLSSPVFMVPNTPLKLNCQKSDTLTQLFLKKGFKPSKIIVRKGTIAHSHGLKETVRAIALCPPGWGLALIGYGNIDFIKDIAKEAGVEKQVLFTGFIPYDSTWDIISSADVGISIYKPYNINTTMQATASQKVFEYMACGIPSIALNTDDFTDLARETKAVSIIDSLSPESIAGGLKYLLGNETRYKEYCTNAYNSHCDFYNYEHLYTPVMDFIDRLSS